MLVILRETDNGYRVSWHEHEGIPAHYSENHESLTAAQTTINPDHWTHPEHDADNDVLFIAYV